jgi:hypothetical protein
MVHRESCNWAAAVACREIYALLMPWLFGNIIWEQQ